MNDDTNLPGWTSPVDGGGPPVSAPIPSQVSATSHAPTEVVPGYPTRVLEGAPEPQNAWQPAPRPRRLKRILLWMLIPLGVVLLAAAGLGAFYAWTQTQFAVVEREGAVMVQHGTDPFVEYERTDVDIALLPTTTRTELVAHIPVEDRAGTAAKIADLREQVTQCQDSLVPPCPPRRLGTASVLIYSSEFPKGNSMRIEWDAVDSRKGVVTTLLVNGKPAPKPCPKTLTSAGKCTFTGRFDTTYKAEVVTKGPKGTTSTVNQVEDHTALKPSVKITKGKKFKGKDTEFGRRGTFCQIVLDVEGFAGNKTYKSTVFMSGHKAHKLKLDTDSSGMFHGVIHSYADPTRDSWVRVKFADFTTKRLNWECGGF